jgi:hypothetical protein
MKELLIYFSDLLEKSPHESHIRAAKEKLCNLTTEIELCLKLSRHKLAENFWRVGTSQEAICELLEKEMHSGRDYVDLPRKLLEEFIEDIRVIR